MDDADKLAEELTNLISGPRHTPEQWLRLSCLHLAVALACEQEGSIETDIVGNAEWFRQYVLREDAR